MQPFDEVTLTRPWHRGIAIVSAPGAAVPDALDQSLVTASPEALVIKVKHAQDVDAERFGGDWDWATATIRVHAESQSDLGTADGRIDVAPRAD